MEVRVAIVSFNFSTAVKLAAGSMRPATRIGDDVNSDFNTSDFTSDAERYRSEHTSNRTASSPNIVEQHKNWDATRIGDDVNSDFNTSDFTSDAERYRSEHTSNRTASSPNIVEQHKNWDAGQHGISTRIDHSNFHHHIYDSDDEYFDSNQTFDGEPVEEVVSAREMHAEGTLISEQEQYRHSKGKSTQPSPNTGQPNLIQKLEEELEKHKNIAIEVSDFDTSNFTSDAERYQSISKSNREPSSLDAVTQNCFQVEPVEQHQTIDIEQLDTDFDTDKFTSDAEKYESRSKPSRSSQEKITMDLQHVVHTPEKSSFDIVVSSNDLDVTVVVAKQGWPEDGSMGIRIYENLELADVDDGWARDNTSLGDHIGSRFVKINSHSVRTEEEFDQVTASLSSGVPVAFTLQQPKKGSGCIGWYTIEKFLGKGGFGVVQQVYETGRLAGPRYAMKEMIKLEQRHMKMAQKEANLMRRLQHEHIIQYIDAFTHEGSFYIVLEIADAGDLANHIKQQIESKNQWEKHVILNCFKQIVSGLDYLHSYRTDETKGILHRDLKPQNILVCASPGSDLLIFKISDFGLARVMEGTFEEVKTRAGTRVYMSPEILSDKPYSFANDIWALGCILFELCTLKRAFNKDVEIWKLSLEFKNLAIAIPTVSNRSSPEWAHWRELSCICSCILVRDPKRRPSCKQLLKEIDRIEGASDKPKNAIVSLFSRMVQSKQGTRYSSMEIDLDAYIAMDDDNGNVKGDWRRNRMIYGLLAILFSIVCVTVWLLEPWQQDGSNIPTQNPTASPTASPCPGLEITSNLEIQYCVSVIGDITVSTGFIGNLDMSSYLPNVRAITGNFVAKDVSNLNSIRFPMLTIVEGDVEIRNNQNLLLVDLEFVESIGGRFDFSRNDLQTLLSFPNLNEVSGNFLVERGDALIAIDFPSVTTIGGSLEIGTRLDNLDSINMTSLVDTLFDRILPSGPLSFCDLGAARQSVCDGLLG